MSMGLGSLLYSMVPPVPLPSGQGAKGMNQPLGGMRPTWCGFQGVDWLEEQEIMVVVIRSLELNPDSVPLICKLPLICSLSSLGLCFLTLNIGMTAPISLEYLRIR